MPAAPRVRLCLTPTNNIGAGNLEYVCFVLAYASTSPRVRTAHRRRRVWREPRAQIRIWRAVGMPVDNRVAISKFDGYQMLIIVSPFHTSHCLPRDHDAAHDFGPRCSACTPLSFPLLVCCLFFFQVFVFSFFIFLFISFVERCANARRFLFRDSFCPFHADGPLSCVGGAARRRRQAPPQHGCPARGSFPQFFGGIFYLFSWNRFSLPTRLLIRSTSRPPLVIWVSSPITFP